MSKIATVIDNNHSVKITRWLLRIINSPVLNPYIMGKSHVFSLFFANLNNNVKWTKKINELISEIENDEKFHENSEDKKQFFSKFTTLNVKEDVTDIMLANLWLGNMLYSKIKSDPKNFNLAISSLTKKYNDYNDQKIIEKPESNEDNLDYIASREHFSKKTIESLYKYTKEQEDISVKLPEYNSVSIFHCHQLFLESFIVMSSLDKELLEFSYVLKHIPIFRDFYYQICDGEYLTETAFNTIFAINEDSEKYENIHNELPVFVSELVPFNEEEKTILTMSDYWYKFFSVPVKDFSELVAKIIVPARQKYHSGTIGNISKEDRDIIDQLLLHLNISNKATNILLYSGSRIDKYNLALNIVKENKLFSYELFEKIPPENLKTACYIAQRFIEAQDPKAVLIVSKAEKVLSKSRISLRQMLFFDIEVEEDIEQKPLEIKLMDNPTIKTIWLAINPQNIHEDSVSRFTYSVEVNPASRGERKEAIEEILKDFDLTDEFKHKLAQHTQLSRQQLLNAMTLAEKMSAPKMSEKEMKKALKIIEKGSGNLSEEEIKLLNKFTNRDRSNVISNEEKEKIIMRAISQSEKALNRKDRENLKKSVTKYSLDYLNVKSGFTVEQIINSLKKKPNSTLCLFGLPGTGKTQFAEYIAISVDKPIIIKNAGEILGKYVGETEKNIQKMFMEAEETDSILLLDEGDSFLRDRTFAKNTWEISMVNQLLQSMERFNGTFICATNLFENLDIAALRRFTFKVEFLAMEPDQRWKMFETEVGEQLNSLSEEDKKKLREDLDFLPNITPGDFTVVKRQEQILDEKLSPESWLKQLTFESETKRKSVSSPNNA